jgi:L-asparaginase
LNAGFNPEAVAVAAVTRRVVIVTTGGTIASRPSGSGVVAAVSGEELIAAVPGLDAERPIEVHDLMRVNAYLLTVEDMLAVASAAIDAAARRDVDGVVVTHGTDTMEETAYLTDLLHEGQEPIVFTGAQRHADAALSDGPANLLDAVRIARSDVARGAGVVIAMQGRIDSARQATKVDTYALRAFGSFDAGPLGVVDTDGIRMTAAARRRSGLPRPAAMESGVVLIKLTAGTDALLLDAAGASGARAIVLECFGLGNANHAVLASVRRAVAEGVLVVVVSRCPAGAVAPVYGNGGGHDLAAAGAVFGGELTGPKARVLVMAALSAADGDAREATRLMEPHLRR